MKIVKQIAPLFVAVLGILMFQSCQEDDDDEQEPFTYPHTVYYSHTIDTEFRMWTNGQEVNTDNLFILDYYSENEFNSLLPSQYEIDSGYVFTDDTLTHPGSLFGPADYHYISRNDSIYFLFGSILNGEPFTHYDFFAFGNQREMRFEQGSFKKILQIQSPLEYNYWNFDNYITQEYLQYTQQAPEDTQYGDTIIIYNRTLIFN